MLELMLLASALFLAFGNGANDNFKGFATVWGSETLTYRNALVLATAATVLGSLASLLFAGTLVQEFSGKGLVAQEVLRDPHFILSVAAGAAVTILLATRLGFPVSTTHALIGALIGAGLSHGVDAVHFPKLVQTFLAPLLVSPLVAMVLAASSARLLKRRSPADDCACLVEGTLDLEIAADGTVASRFSAPEILVASDVACESMATPVRVSLSRSLDRVHILSAAAICFARGVNDTPKLAALMIAGQMLAIQHATIMVAVVMAVGGLLFARGVAETMSQRVTSLDHGQGIAANLVTAVLVLFASKLGMPVSTTHVSVGSIIGVGASAHTLHWGVVRNVLLSWVVTLPLAAGVAYGVIAVMAG